MLIRISLIVAIIAALAVGVLNFVQVKNKIETLKANLKEQTEGRQRAETDLAKTKKDLAKTQADLKTTQDNLATTTAAKDKAVADLDLATKKNTQLTEDLAKTKKEREDFQAENSAYKLVFSSPEQAAAAGKQIKQLQDALTAQGDENKLLAQKLKKVETKLATYEDPNKPVTLSAKLAGKVLVTDPRWEFVVLDVGSDQGALEHGQLLVNRNGKLVAKVVITSVQKDRCIANVIPGWKLGEVLEGDQVIPAYPES
jgi:myosin heavy subunit